MSEPKRDERSDDVQAAIWEFAMLISHGDSEHRRWLFDAARAFCYGIEIPPARGSGLSK